MGFENEIVPEDFLISGICLNVVGWIAYACLSYTPYAPERMYEPPPAPQREPLVMKCDAARTERSTEDILDELRIFPQSERMQPLPRLQFPQKQYTQRMRHADSYRL